MGEILRHKKTGGLYEVLLRGAQVHIHDDASLADDALVTVYRAPGDQIVVVPIGATVEGYVSHLHSARTQTAAGLICGDEVVIYRNLVGGRVWVRPTSEMDDGRFEPVHPDSATPSGDGAEASSTPGEVERLVIDHEFKGHPSVFGPLARGEKTFEFRKDDRPGGFHVGQVIRVRSYDPEIGYLGEPPVIRRITNILRPGEFGLQDGFCILSLAQIAISTADATNPQDQE